MWGLTELNGRYAALPLSRCLPCQQRYTKLVGHRLSSLDSTSPGQIETLYMSEQLLIRRLLHASKPYGDEISWKGNPFWGGQIVAAP